MVLYVWEVVGNGCHKIRDFSALPGFANDNRQVFLYMDETCEVDAGAGNVTTTGTPTMTPTTSKADEKAIPTSLEEPTMAPTSDPVSMYMAAADKMLMKTIVVSAVLLACIATI